ncbi:hypothetical protein EDB89DRAFT_2228136 [Lactarius sanguifluus]|nr:hypothetical protein EDB89DRAFT_2228136 [Lactarius sanguifluus]
MAAVIQDPPSPPAGFVESSKILFDYPDADVVLRSHDFQMFRRVPKLYITNSSNVLGELIQAAPDTSDATDSASVQTRLPEVQLSERSAILSSLLTFIFPVNPVLPSNIEETMELLNRFLSVRRTLSSLTHSHRGTDWEEASQAARLTLKFTLTIESLEDKLAIMPGDYLHELWKYHQKVQAQLTLDLFSSGASVTVALRGFDCSQCTKNGNPYWIELYIWSIIDYPSRFDPIEFQMALAHQQNDTSLDWLISSLKFEHSLTKPLAILSDQ